VLDYFVSRSFRNLQQIKHRPLAGTESIYILHNVVARRFPHVALQAIRGSAGVRSVVDGRARTVAAVTQTAVGPVAISAATHTRRTRGVSSAHVAGDVCHARREKCLAIHAAGNIDTGVI
jgi:hypothetical protein